MRTALQHHYRKLRERHQRQESVSDRERASAIWHLLPRRVQDLLNPEFQAGFSSWEFDRPCVNPHVVEQESWKWAAFQMGWTHAQESNGGR